MALSHFEDSSHAPGQDDLAAVLGRSARLWSRLVDDVCTRYGPMDQIWNFGGARNGWSLRLRRKDRNILYLIPQKGRFLVGLVLGEKAASLAQHSDLPPDVLAAIDAAPRYAEGRGIRLPVTTKADVESLLTLVSIKLAGGR